jgi:hypothetical protein
MRNAAFCIVTTCISETARCFGGGGGRYIALYYTETLGSIWATRRHKPEDRPLLCIILFREIYEGLEVIRFNRSVMAQQRINKGRPDAAAGMPTACITGLRRFYFGSFVSSRLQKWKWSSQETVFAYKSKNKKSKAVPVTGRGGL